MSDEIINFKKYIYLFFKKNFQGAITDDIID
jgi:hypothetical protein